MPIYGWLMPRNNTWATYTTDCGTASTAYWVYANQTAATNSITMPWIMDTTGGTFTTMQAIPYGQPLIPGPRMRRLQEQLAAPAVLHRPPDPEAVERERLERLLREEARERSRALLLQHLTEEQRAMLTNRGWFIVEGGRSRTRYRIRASSAAGNVDVLGQLPDHVLHRLCAHCDLSLPLADQLLAQKLMLEASEDEFLRIANRHHA